MQNIKKTLSNSVVYSNLFLAFFVLSVLMLNVAGVFHIPGIVDHPQFSKTADSGLIKDIICRKGNLGNIWLTVSYYAFFIIDFVWAFCLLLLVKKFVQKKLENSNSAYANILLKIFTVCVLLAYVFDVSENINYICNITYNKTLTYTKIFFYAVVAIAFLISLIRYLFQEFLPTLGQFLLSSTYSLIILLIIGGLLPTMPQVNSIVVDLYLKPWNLIILLFMTPVLAVVLAHYPSYFRIERHKRQRQWYMAKMKLWVLGIVHYRYIDGSQTAEESEAKGRLNFLFRVLGICFYSALFYTIAYTAEVNFNWQIKSSVLSFTLLVCGVFLLYILKEQKDDWYDKNFEYLNNELPFFYDGDYTPKGEREKTKIVEKITKTKLNKEETSNPAEFANGLSSISRHIKVYLWLFVATILLHVILFVMVSYCPNCSYSEIIIILSLVCIFLQTVTFVYYRSFRSLFRFVFYNRKAKSILDSFIKRPYGEELEKKSLQDLEDYLKKQKLKVELFFDDESYPKPKCLSKLATFLRFGALSNNKNFLQANAAFGVVNAVFFLILNYSSEAAVTFSSILIILSAMLLYYGILVVMTKNYIYYRYSKEENRKKNWRKFVYGTLALLFLLLTLNRLAGGYSNELFSLELIERNPEAELSLAEYKKIDSTGNRYYVACYGGGMKSNAWTMAVLKELYDRDPRFFNKTVVISGVSGGTMGLANMSAIMKANKDDGTWPELVRGVATENILSLDIAHMLGRDTFSHLFVPGLFRLRLTGYDRSSKAMKRYARLTNNTDLNCVKVPFREYWRNLYDASPTGSFPILIANSTNVRGNQGMAVSVKVKAEDSLLSSILYHGADNILEMEDPIVIENSDTIGYAPKTLSYYDAMSTSNRFPLISPAAKIETKGHFNDGGIYENSGLLSAYKLFKAINHRDTINNLNNLGQRNTFINIVNSKSAYIRQAVDSVKCKPSKINKSTETSAILESVADTEMMPRYIKHELSQLAIKYPNIEFETIYLPHRFTVADVKNLLGEELYCNRKVKTDSILYELVKRNNEIIENIVRGKYKCAQKHTPIIEPPMSRVMADPAFEFMLQMLEHDTPNDAIDRIFDDSTKN